MKKQLVSLFAMACMVFASSCSQEEIVSQSTGNEVAVTFTANLRNDVKSRAVGDDTDNVDQLVFAVYDKNGKELQELRQSTHMQDDDAKKAITLTDNGVMKEAKIEVVLVKGQTYSFAFWAQKKGHAAYSFDPETAKVEISYQNTNDKSADAFFASVTNHKVTGTFEKNVTLKRPFAQINFLTTAQDLKDAAKSEFTPSQSQIVVKNAATELNVLDGTVSGNTDVTFGLAGLVGHDLDNATADERVKIKSSGKYVGFTSTGTFPLVDTEDKAEPFIYLATAYFLPTLPTTSTDIDASVLVKATGKDDYELAVTKVKAQRNYRTNIYGNLLTSNGTFYVTVDPGFVDDYSYEEEDETTKVVGTIEEANALFAEGETNVTITEAPEANANVELPNTDESVTINFVFEDETEASTTITVGYKSGASEKPAHVDINGNDKVIGNLVIDVPESTATVNVGEYTNVTATTKANTLYVPKGVKIGTLTLNQGNAEIYYGAVTGTITKAKGCTITWTVDSKEQLAQFAEAVNTGKSYSGETIALISDIDLNNEEWTPIGDCNSGKYFQGTFDGQNHTIYNLKVDKSTDADKHSTAGLFGWIDSAGATIKNVNVDGATVKGSHWVGVIAGYMTGEISGCTVTNATVLGVNVNDDANGDKIGGIVGFLNDQSKALNDNTVAKSTIIGNRDIGGIAGGVAKTIKDMSNNNVTDVVITYTTAKEYASAGKFVSGRTGYVPNNTNVATNVTIVFDGVAASVDELKGVLASGATEIELAKGNYTFPASSIQAGTVINCEEGVVFEGKSSLNINGATVIGGTFVNEGNTAVSGTINGTFKNCTFEGAETLRWCYTKAGETAVFENCVVKTTLRGVHFDGMNGDVIFRNCKINGFNAYSGAGTMTFENCTFGHDKSKYNGLNIYTNTVLKDCEFAYVSDNTNFIDMEGTGKTLKITNCSATLNGETTEISTFVGGSKLAENTVIYE